MNGSQGAWQARLQSQTAIPTQTFTDTCGTRKPNPLAVRTLRSTSHRGTAATRFTSFHRFIWLSRLHQAHTTPTMDSAALKTFSGRFSRLSLSHESHSIAEAPRTIWKLSRNAFRIRPHKRAIGQ